LDCIEYVNSTTIYFRCRTAG